MLSRSSSFVISAPFSSSTTKASLGVRSGAGSFINCVRLLGNNLASKMSFHFASSEYAKCFQGLPTPDVPKLRSSATKYLDAFDKESWFKDPVSHVCCLQPAKAQWPVSASLVHNLFLRESSLDCFTLEGKRTSWRYHD
jgi:hypothetical protein